MAKRLKILSAGVKESKFERAKKMMPKYKQCKEELNEELKEENKKRRKVQESISA
jgi:hypothetical protein